MAAFNATVGELKGTVRDIKQMVIAAVDEAVAPYKAQLEVLRLEMQQLRAEVKAAPAAAPGGYARAAAGQGPVGVLDGTQYLDRVKIVGKEGMSEGAVKQALEQQLETAGVAASVVVKRVMTRRQANGDRAQAGPAGAHTAAAAAPARTRDGRPIMLALVNPAMWKDVMRQLQALHEKGIDLREYLTKEGMELRNQRVGVYKKLKAEEKKPRWEHGAELSLMEGGRRVPYTGPWVQGA
ncbi:hypothetical protein HYH03_004283 [Edaphochlamys debaryana]|uniref:Uncharacterized protein n=1 Tax=Edaphochlamys debaryana TaxID=47281 RepID=A0A836C2Q4_9CHLO|nr:hypothetical protein HYH03_004283 [Edaphochlamys debaryana]|eukprot:KAG2498025.1 hypothetical protein HYH03_004283 [Edaphochlamys debaryana]